MKTSSPKLLEAKKTHLTSKIHGLETHLATLQSRAQVENQAAQQSLADTKTKTEELLLDRAKALEELEAPYKGRIQESEAILKDLSHKIEVAETLYKNRLYEKDIISEELGNEQVALDTVKDNIITANDKLNGLGSEIKLRTKELESVQELISQANVIQTRAESDFEDVKKALITTQAKVAAEEVAWQTKIEDYQVQIKSLESRQGQLLGEIRETEAYFETEREELAQRMIAANELDANLRQREAKLSLDQQKISRNANLLKL